MSLSSVKFCNCVNFYSKTFFYSKTSSNLFLHLYFLETVNRYNQHSMHKVSSPQIPNLLEFSFILLGLVQEYSNDIGMQFGMDRFNVSALRHVSTSTISGMSNFERSIQQFVVHPVREGLRGFFGASDKPFSKLTPWMRSP